MIKEFLTRPTVFPMEAEEPWRIVENLCESITHLIEILDDDAHFNFVGDSIIGNDVNIEAGAILCNHYNERELLSIF